MPCSCHLLALSEDVPRKKNTKRHMRHSAYPNSGPCNTWFSEERRKANTKNKYLFACIQTNIIEGIIFAQLDWYWASQCFFRVFNSPLDPRLESIEWRSFEHTNFYYRKVPSVIFCWDLPVVVLEKIHKSCPISFTHSPPRPPTRTPNSNHASTIEHNSKSNKCPLQYTAW